MEQTALKNLEDKLEQLLKKYQGLQKENMRLKAKLQETDTALARANKDKEALQLKIDAGAIGSVRSMDEQQRALLQTRIDQYLKDIDKCLTLLDA